MRIKPLTKKCQDCNKEKVRSHHWLCDDCWGKRAKAKSQKEKKKLIEPLIRRLRNGN